MEITKEVKPFIRTGWPNTFGNIVYVTPCLYIYYRFGAQETFLSTINVEKLMINFSAWYFSGNLRFFWIIWWIEHPQKYLKYKYFLKYFLYFFFWSISCICLLNKVGTICLKKKNVYWPQTFSLVCVLALTSLNQYYVINIILNIFTLLVLAPK